MNVVLILFWVRTRTTSSLWKSICLLLKLQSSKKNGFAIYSLADFVAYDIFCFG
jgi:hypothetical protein